MSSPASSNSDQEKEDMHDGAEENETSKKVEDKGDIVNEVSKSEETEKKEEKSEKRDNGSDNREDDDEDEKNEVGLLDRPVEMSGSRDRKKVQRLEYTFNTVSKEKTEIPEGTGEKLGDCPRIEHQIQKNSIEALKQLHKILFARLGPGLQLKRNIRKFNGFTFEKDSNDYEKKKAALDKIKSANLKHMCEILDIERSGTKEDIVLRVLDFLLQPKASGKALPKPKRKTSAKGVKRKQIKSGDAGKKKSGKKTKDSDDDDKEEDDDDDGSDTDEEPKKKKAKPAPKKSQHKNESSKKSAKKSSSKQKDDSSDERSSDDEPLVKISKSPPTNDDIKAYVKKVLKAADLQTVTMKTVIQQVYDHYPDFDLASRKDFIKATVKSVIS